MDINNFLEQTRELSGIDPDTLYCVDINSLSGNREETSSIVIMSRFGKRFNMPVAAIEKIMPISYGYNGDFKQVLVSICFKKEFQCLQTVYAKINEITIFSGSPDHIDFDTPDRLVALDINTGHMNWFELRAMGFNLEHQIILYEYNSSSKQYEPKNTFNFPTGRSYHERVGYKTTNQTNQTIRLAYWYKIHPYNGNDPWEQGWVMSFVVSDKGVNTIQFGMVNDKEEKVGVVQLTYNKHE